MSKGSRPRPFSIPIEEIDNRYDTIFGKKPLKPRWVPPPLPKDIQHLESSHERLLGKNVPLGRT